MKVIPIVVLMLITNTVFAHGYIVDSRAHLCQKGNNSGCGGVRYEPQSVEGTDRFPESGPSDGTIAAAGSRSWASLNEQTPSRWKKVKMQSGENVFNWVLTAPHYTKDWRYFITKENWDPAQPLSRDSFQLQPFCHYQENGMPPSRLSHTCEVPERQGYHVILGVWDVGDTSNSFYHVMDVEMSGSGNVNNGGDINNGGDVDGEDTGATYHKIGNINPSHTLNVGDRVRLRLFDASGEINQSFAEMKITQPAQGRPNNWTQAFARYINRQSIPVSAGIMNNAGNIVPVSGQNAIYTMDDSGIVSAEIAIDFADDVTEEDDQSLDVKHVKTRYISDQLAVVKIRVKTSEPMRVKARLYQDQKQVAFAGKFTRKNKARGLRLRVDNPQGGEYKLVVTAKARGNKNIVQKTLSINLEDKTTDGGNNNNTNTNNNKTSNTGSNKNAPTYPDKRGQYGRGDMVYGQDGSLYQCVIPGWCNNISNLYYEPGRGLAWQQAWQKIGESELENIELYNEKD